MNKQFPMTYMMLDARCCPKRRGPFLELIIFYLAYWIIKAIESVVATIPQLVFFFKDPEFLALMDPERLETITVEEYTEVFVNVANRMPPWVIVFTLFATVVTIAGAIFVCLKLEQRNLSSMGIRRRGFFAEYGLGLLIGSALLGLAVLIAHATDAIEVTANPDANLGLILVFFFAFAIQALSEELLCRGYLMMSLFRTASPLASVLISALIFAVLHSGNTAVTPLALLNIFLVGIIFGVYTLKRGNIWGAAAIHAAWNFMQGNVFGIPVSGSNTSISLFNVSLNELRHQVNGGSFGLEGGLAVTIVLLIAIGLVFPLKAKKSELASVHTEDDQETA